MKKFKKVLSTLCIMVMICLTTIAFAACGKKKDPPPQDPTPPETETPSGHYWDDDPNAFVINSFAEWQAFTAYIRNNDQADTEFEANDEMYVVLANDIDCGGILLDPIISKDKYGIRFTIDGDGHTIKNFKLNKTKVETVQSSGGSSTSGFKVVSLFPLFQGGTLKNINFENVTVDLTLGAGEAADYHVGIVGYSYSSGSNDGDVTNNVCSTYKDIKIKNMKVTASATETTTTNGNYPLSIGALIGMDSDFTEIGSTITTDSTTMATRENITVEKFEVNVTKNTGALFIGGVSGQTHFGRTTFKNCVVDAKFNVTNNGTDVKDTLAAKNLGDLTCLGGIFGANQKDTCEIFVEGGKVTLESTVNNTNYRAGTVSGLVLEPAAITEGTVHAVHVNNTFTATATVKVGDGNPTNVTKQFEIA